MSHIIWLIMIRVLINIKLNTLVKSKYKKCKFLNSVKPRNRELIVHYTKCTTANAPIMHDVHHARPSSYQTYAWFGITSSTLLWRRTKPSYLPVCKINPKAQFYNDHIYTQWPRVHENGSVTWKYEGIRKFLFIVYSIKFIEL